VVRLDDDREREADAPLYHVLEVARGDELTARRVDARALEDQLREPLVERDGVRVRVRARVRNAQLFEERRVERFTHSTVRPFGGVEDDVGIDLLEALEQVRGRTADLDLLDFMPRCLESSCDRTDCLGAVVLGFLFRFPDVGEPKIVRKRNFHGVITR
jgi:hypothetical protein